jgi:type II secretory pathway pseudopilin PulG
MNRKRGATILELLIVVGVLGIISAIAIWNYWISIERAKAKKTAADIRAIGTAWEARETDRGSYNAAGALFTWPAESLTYEDTVANLAPTYIRALPRNDGWGRPLHFALDEPFGGTPAKLYGIRSMGRDGLVDASYDTTPTDEFDCDIVFSNGVFVIYPENVN